MRITRSGMRVTGDYADSVIHVHLFERKDIMVKTIRLTLNDVKHFVDVTTKCDFDVDISYNRYVVDAKSLLGVYALDFEKPLTVSYDGCNSEFEEMLRQYTVAC